MKFSHLAIELFEFVGYLPYLSPEQRKVMSRGFNLEPIVDLLKASLPASLAKTNKNNDDDDDSEVLSNESNGNKVLPNHARQLPREHKNDTESLDLIIDVGALCHPKLLQEEDAVASGDCVDVVHACQAQDFQDFDDNAPHDYDFEQNIQDPQESCYHYGTCATATTTAHGGYQHSTGWKVGTFYYNEEDDVAPTFYEDSQARLLSLNKVECTPQNTRVIEPTSDYFDIGDFMKPCLPADDCDFPISCWDVSRVKSMYKWFTDIKVGDSINLRNWNTENVESMNYIFYFGRVPPGIWAWNVKNLKSTNSMFAFAEDLKNVYLQRWNLESVRDDSYYMFQSTDWFHMHEPNELQTELTDDEIVRVCPHLKLLHSKYPHLLSGFRLEGNVIDCYCPKTAQSKVPIDSNEELKNWIDAEFQKEEKDQHFGCVEIGPNVDSFQDLFRDKKFIPNGIWGWDVSQVKSMNYTFRGANIEQPLGIENWDLSQVTYAKGMFFQSQFRNDYLDTVDISTMSETAHMEGLFDDVIYDLLMDQLTPLRLRNLKPYLKYVVSRRAPVECTEANTRVIDPDFSDLTVLNEFMEPCLPWDDCSHPISCWDVSKVKSMYNWFVNSEFVSLDFKNWDTSNVESLASMFTRSSGDILGVHEWDVSKVKDMSLMFQSANVPLGISNWDTAAVERLDFMFQDARNLENVDLQSWDLNAVLPQAFAYQDVFKGTPYHRSKLAELKDDQILRVCPYLHLLRRNGQGDFSTFVPNGANEFSCFCPKGPWIQTTNEDFKMKLSAERTKAPSDRRFGCIEIGEDVDDMVGIFNTFDYIPNAIWTWDVSRVTTLEEAFSYVGDDTESGKIEQPLRLERWNLESLTEAQFMFRGTNFGDHLHTLDMSSVPETANMTYMFLDSSARPDSDFESDGSVDGWTDTQIKALLPYVKFVRKKRMERECPA